MEMAKWAIATELKTESSTTPTAQGLSYHSHIFSGKKPCLHTVPPAPCGSADLLESALGLCVPSSIVQHRHPLSNTLQTTEEACPSAGNSAPSAWVPDECLKSKVILPPLALCTFPKRGGESLWRQPHIHERSLLKPWFSLLGNHIPTSLLFLTKSRSHYLRKKIYIKSSHFTLFSSKLMVQR